MGELQKKIQATWFAERERWILWLPVFLGIGVGTYFGLHDEPSRWLVSTITVGLAIVCIACWRAKKPVGAMLLLALTWVALGVTAATWRTHWVDAPILHKQLYPQMVMGRIVDITTRPDSTRLTLEHAKLEYLDADKTPKYMTVSLREHASDDIGLGDEIRVKAGFFPPPKPVMPGGFAFNRHFFFKQIGATGYAVGKTQPEIIQKASEAGGFWGWLAKLRHSIASQLMREMGMREGSVAAALMVGESKAIPPEIYESMRQSGLVHVLSISGMHLTLAAGIFFFAARFLFSCIPALALRFDGKKLAAVAALFGTFCYLLLAGLPISAQRSFVMVALVLFAVMLSRTVTPIRSLCFAAVLLLLITPESLLNPGFQLSFAATMAILAYYEHWMRKRGKVPPEEWGWRQKQVRFWGGIIVTSTVASFATMPYVIHHFDGLPLYSVVANLVVMPLVSFVIMPLVVLVLVLLPFGMATWLLTVLKLGIKLMLYVASQVHAMPYAVLDVPPLATPWLVVITLGGLWLCFWQTRWRYFGLIAIAIGLSSLMFYTPPDMVISADGKKIALRTAPDKVVMLRGQRNGFQQDGWKRFLRVQEFHLRRQAEAERLRCDELGCVYNWKNTEVAVSGHRATLKEDCAQSDMVITPEWSAYYDTRKLCSETTLYDRSWLGKMQGVAFWLNDGQVRYRTVLETLGNRPWSGR